MNRHYEGAPVPSGNPLEPAVVTAELRFSCLSCGGGIRWCERRILDTGKKCCRRCDCAEAIKAWEELRDD